MMHERWWMNDEWMIDEWMNDEWSNEVYENETSTQPDPEALPISTPQGLRSHLGKKKYPKTYEKTTYLPIN